MAGLFPFPFQILDIDPEDQAEEDGGHTDLDSQRKGKCVVIKTSTRQVSQPSLHLSAKCMGFTTVVQGKIMPPPPLFSLSVTPSLPYSSPPFLSSVDVLLTSGGPGGANGVEAWRPCGGLVVYTCTPLHAVVVDAPPTHLRASTRTPTSFWKNYQLSE